MANFTNRIFHKNCNTLNISTPRSFTSLSVVPRRGRSKGGNEPPSATTSQFRQEDPALARGSEKGGNPPLHSPYIALAKVQPCVPSRQPNCTSPGVHELAVVVEKCSPRTPPSPLALPPRGGTSQMFGFGSLKSARPRSPWFNAIVVEFGWDFLFCLLIIGSLFAL